MKDSDLVSHGTGELVHSGSRLGDLLCGIDDIGGILQRAFSPVAARNHVCMFIS